MRARLVMVGIAALLVAGCAAFAGPTPACTNTTWESYKGLTDLSVPAGMTVDSTSRTGVTVKNTTSQPWTVLVARWQNGMCSGWVRSEGTYATIAAGSSRDLTAQDPGAGALESRIGVVFWDHAPDAASPGPATGFGWVEVPLASASN